MTNPLSISIAATAMLDRPISPEFVVRVIDGDPFVYGRALDEDTEATRTVLGIATGRLS